MTSCFNYETITPNSGLFFPYTHTQSYTWMRSGWIHGSGALRPPFCRQGDWLLKSTVWNNEWWESGVYSCVNGCTVSHWTLCLFQRPSSWSGEVQRWPRGHRGLLRIKGKNGCFPRPVIPSSNSLSHFTQVHDFIYVLLFLYNFFSYFFNKISHASKTMIDRILLSTKQICCKWRMIIYNRTVSGLDPFSAHFRSP